MKFDIILSIFSGQASGAEKRLTRLVYFLSDQSLAMMINKKLFNQLNNSDEFRNIVATLLDKKALIIIPEPPKVIEKSAKLNLIWMLFIATLNLIFYRPKILHVALGASYLAVLSKILRCCIILEVTSPDYVKYVINRKIIIDNVNIFHVVSYPLKNMLINFVAEDKFRVDPLPFFVACQINDVKYDHPVITYCGRFIERKNPVLFAKVAKKMLENNQNLQVFILGRGPLEDEVKSILSDQILLGKVFIKFVPNPSEYLQISTLFVSLIEPENYPSQAIFEAMNYRLPLIVLDTPLAYKFTEKNNGFLVKKSEQDIYSKCQLLIDDNLLAKSMGIKSRVLLEEKFSHDSYLLNIKKIYSECFEKD